MKDKVIPALNIFFILLAGFIRIMEGLPIGIFLKSFLCFIETTLYLVGTVFWYLSLRERILDKNLRNKFLFIAADLSLLIIVKMLKYHTYNNPVAVRYFDYSYYVFMSFAVSGFLMIITYLAKPVGYKFKKVNYVVFIPALIISLFIMTNDLHQLNYLVNEEGKETIQLGQFILMGTLGLELLVAIVMIAIKCSVPAFHKKIYIPILIFIAIVIYYLALFVSTVRFPYAFSDFAAIALILFIESFIYIGLIRSNKNYREIFINSSLNAFITDKNFNLLAKAENARIYSKEELKTSLDGFFIKDDIRLNALMLKGDIFYYEESLENIRAMNKKLKDVIISLDEENEMLREEAKIKEKKTHIQEEMKIYDEVINIITPAVNKIEKYLSNLHQEDKDYPEKAAFLCFIICYIKRRINMTLIDKMEGVNKMEFNFAINELVSVCCLNGVETSYYLNKENDIRPFLEYFDYCYEILSKCIKEAEACYISMNKDYFRISIDKKDGSVIYNYPSMEEENI